jgi:hypothetical protein
MTGHRMLNRKGGIPKLNEESAQDEDWGGVEIGVRVGGMGPPRGWIGCESKRDVIDIFGVKKGWESEGRSGRKV